MTFEDLLHKHKGDVDKVASEFIRSTILITVPHAYARDDVNHSRDRSALRNALKLHGQLPNSLLHVGDIDRRDADLNRATTDLSKEYHEFISLWIQWHPDGVLLDVHSYPPGFNWKNETTTLKTDVITTDELVCLLPWKHKEFATEFAKSWDIGPAFQGTLVNKIINMGCKKSILLEFNELLE